MFVCLTFDYELFFGSRSGTVKKCLLEPTEKLLQIFSKHKIQTTFFVDASYLLKLRESAIQNPFSADEWSMISTQLIYLVNDGHELGLHIHPHWMDVERKGKNWQMSTDRYRFHQWEKDIRDQHFNEACALLREYYKGLASFRAGGWCIQPFEDFKALFEKNRLFIDSSVVPGFKMNTRHHQFDFTDFPEGKSYLKFSYDPCKEDADGPFLELPVSADIISPWHQYKMFWFHRINPEIHLPLGDGDWIKDKSFHYKKYIFPYKHFASTDGYYVSRMKNNLMKTFKKGEDIYITLGHPKSMSVYSFEELEKFIVFAKSQGVRFSTLKSLAEGLI
ncbi:MAG: hypothetical protein N3F09_05195 [Bacteroidia bacterium]|nr:hypothetical protein [Bacteroidia bacterium]